ncbi:MAG: hemerythrin domain-containing protein [Betaproteobacteria bacterium]
MVTVHKDHHSLAAMLGALKMVIARGPHEGSEEFFRILRAMLFYVREFSDQVHYPRESDLYFPLVMEALPNASASVQRNEQSHVNAVHELGMLQRQLSAWQRYGASQRQAFETAAVDLCDRFMAQIELEEADLAALLAQLVDDDAAGPEIDLHLQRESIAPTGTSVENTTPLAIGQDQEFDRLYIDITHWLTQFVTPPSRSKPCMHSGE